MQSGEAVAGSSAGDGVGTGAGGEGVAGAATVAAPVTAAARSAAGPAGPPHASAESRSAHASRPAGRDVRGPITAHSYSQRAMAATARPRGRTQPREAWTRRRTR